MYITGSENLADILSIIRMVFKITFDGEDVTNTTKSTGNVLLSS